MTLWDKIELEYRYWRNRIQDFIQNTFVRQRLVYSIHVDNPEIEIPNDFTFSMDHGLALFLDNAFTAFMADSFELVGPPEQFKMTDDEWKSLVTYIRDGFRKYHESYDWPIGMPSEEWDERREEAKQHCKESFELLGKYLEGFWW